MFAQARRVSSRTSEVLLQKMNQVQTDVGAARQIYVVGDIHGHYSKLVGLLTDHNLINEELTWCGEDATVCFIGDYVDRGPQGVEAIELVMRLQTEATESGGNVVALLGNHEVLILAARRFANAHSPDGSAFKRSWRRNGGVEEELERLSQAHVDWMSSLPAMALLGNRLIMHADSMLYATYGNTIDEVNQSFREMLQSESQRIWLRLINEFAERFVFSHGGLEGREKVAELLELYGGNGLIHGHTPIAYVIDSPPHQIRGPLIYADKKVVNVDGGMCHGGPGFIYQYQG